MLLALDTATATASLALYDLTRDTLVAEWTWQARRRHTQDLLGAAQTLLHQAGATPAALTALAVTTGKRSSALAEVPTLDEAGLKGFDVSSWFGLMAPAGTPPEIIQKTYVEIAKMLGTPEMRQQLALMGAEPIGNTPEQLRQQIAGEITRFAALAQKARLQLD